MKLSLRSRGWRAAVPSSFRHDGIGRFAAAISACLVLASSASAGVVSAISSRALLGGNDTVQWGAAADDGSLVASPYSRVSTGGVGVAAALTGGFGVFVQNGGGGYTSNFSAGDVVLSTFFTDGPISITFASAIRGLGFNVVNDNFGAFTGTLDFFGAGDVFFGSVGVGGASSNANDGSAPFLGGFSSLRDILRVDVSVTSVLGGSPLSINQMSLLTTAPPAPPGGGNAPEPATATLVGLALATTLMLRRRRSSRLADAV